MQRRSESERKEDTRLEDLLLLKRHEKPDDLFWDKFDRELEAKRLMVLVNRQPWYHRLSHALMQRVYPLSAMGAAALVLFVFVAYQSSQLNSPVGIEGEPTDLNASSSLSQGQSDVASEALQSEAPVFLVADLEPAQFEVPSVLPEANFGIDVITPEPKTYRFRQFTTVMQPTAFRVTQEDGIIYGKDSFRPDASNIRVRSTSSPF